MIPCLLKRTKSNSIDDMKIYELLKKCKCCVSTRILIHPSSPTYFSMCPQIDELPKVPWNILKKKFSSFLNTLKSDGTLKFYLISNSFVSGVYSMTMNTNFEHFWSLDVTLVIQDSCRRWCRYCFFSQVRF